MKQLTTFLFLFISSMLFSQLKEISKIHVTDSTIVLNDSAVLSYPMNIDNLIKLLGDARTNDSPKSSNSVYYWDRFGIMAFTEKGNNTINSFEVCLSRSSIGPNTRRKFQGKLIVQTTIITKKMRTEDYKNAGYTTDEPDKILNSYHTLELKKLRVVVETERKDKRTTGIGVASYGSW